MGNADLLLVFLTVTMEFGKNCLEERFIFLNNYPQFVPVVHLTFFLFSRERFPCIFMNLIYWVKRATRYLVPQAERNYGLGVGWEVNYVFVTVKVLRLYGCAL